MDRDDLLKECKRLKSLLKHLKQNPQSEPYQSISVEFVIKTLSGIGSELLKHDIIYGGKRGKTDRHGDC